MRKKKSVSQRIQEDDANGQALIAIAFIIALIVIVMSLLGENQ